MSQRGCRVNERELLEKILDELRGIRRDRRELWSKLAEIVKSALGHILAEIKGRFNK
jgi:hypothetical protein